MTKTRVLANYKSAKSFYIYAWSASFWDS